MPAGTNSNASWARAGWPQFTWNQDLKHDRMVALKVLAPELAATLGPERFIREIRLTAKLEHPHILPVLDSGEDARPALVYDALCRAGVVARHAEPSGTQRWRRSAGAEQRHRKHAWRFGETALRTSAH